MTLYQNVSRQPAAFYNLFGYAVADFDALYVAFAAAHERRLAQSPLTRKKGTPRKRRPGAGRRFQHPLRDRLLLALFWRQVYPTLELLGFFFALDKTSAEDNLKDALATLATLAGFAPEPFATRREKRRTQEQVLDAFPDAALLLNVRGEPRKRPTNPKTPPPSDDAEGSEGRALPEGEPPTRAYSGRTFRSGVAAKKSEAYCPTNLLYRDLPAFDNGATRQRRT